VPVGREIETRFRLTDGHVRIEVHDSSTETPVRRLATSSRRRTRLWLVETLADSWDVAPRDGVGKVVWAEFACRALEVVAVARNPSRVPAVRVRRGDEVTVRGRRAEVKAVRDRSSSGRSVLILVFKSARPVRVDASERVRVERGGGGRRERANRGWFR